MFLFLCSNICRRRIELPETNLKKIKKALEEKKKSKLFESTKEKFETVDLEKVEKIVNKMKKKYASEGISFEEVGGSLSELRGIIAEGKTAKVQIQKVEELKEFKSAWIRNLGKLYMGLRVPFYPLVRLIRALPPVKDIGFYLYSANMPFSTRQYLALVSAISILVGLITFIVTAFLFSTLGLPIALSVSLVIVLSFFAFFFAAMASFLYPRSKANQRGDAVSLELPFALRHMSTELKAGIGLYRTLQAIAQSDYGALSEEFAQVINEIEEGTDSKDALRHLALRTQSKPLRSSIMHIIRALKTGGNLSEIMNQIAEDVSFQIRENLREFAEKMNFFGVIFIFIAIVSPVFVAVLGSIRNAPLGLGGESIFSTLPLTPLVIALFYIVIMPLILGYLVFYLKISQPKI